MQAIQQNSTSQINFTGYRQENSLNQFFHRIEHESTHAWAFFKEKCLGISQAFPLNDPERLAEHLLTVKPFSYEGYLLKQTLKKCSKETLTMTVNLALDRLLEDGTHIRKILSFFDTVSLKSIIDKPIDPLIKALIEFPGETLPRIEPHHSLKKTLRVVWRFFPNFLDTVLKAFNLFEAGKNPETIWDFAAVFEIYFKIFLIPHGILLGVSAFTESSLLILGVSTAITLTLIIGICLYLHYRPCPSSIGRSINITEGIKNGEILPIIGRENEIAEVVQILETNNLFLIGESGVGKTTLMNGVASKISKNIFVFNTPEIANLSYTSFADLMNLIYVDVKGREQECIFFFDEFGLVADKEVITPLYKRFESIDSVQVVLGMTQKQYESIAWDESFLRRFAAPYHLKPPTKEETIRIINYEISKYRTQYVPQKGLAEKIYESTKSESQPASSLKKLSEIRKLTLVVSNPELGKAREAFNFHYDLYQEALQDNHPLACELAKQLPALQLSVQAQEKENSEQIAHITHLRKLLTLKWKWVDKRIAYSKKVTSNRNELLFAVGIVLPRIDQAIEGVLGKIKGVSRLSC